MNELQIGRNLGAMFESAARHLNFDAAKNVTLPPSVTSFINTNYYNTKTVFSTIEVIKGLESTSDSEVYAVLKYVVNRMTARSDTNQRIQMQELYPHIMKKVNSSNLKIKRLVYAIILQNNHLFQDLTLLSINAIQKSLSDQNAIIRSMAIRCLSGIQIPAILPILLLSLSKLVKDSAPIVRCASAIAIVKCYQLDDGKNEDIKNQLSGYLDLLLSDDDPKVLSIAISAYKELFYGNFDMFHNKVEHLICNFEELDGFAIVNLIDILINYVQLFFPRYDGLNNAPYELVKLYEQLNDRLMYEMESNVTLSIVQCLVKLFPNDCKTIERSIIKLIQPNIVYDNSAQISIALNYIYILLQQEKVQFRESQISNFFPSFNDNTSIFQMKSKIFFKLIGQDNFKKYYPNLKLILDSDFNWVCKKSILQNLNNLVNSTILPMEEVKQIIDYFMLKLKTETNNILISEYITGLRQLIQSDVSSYGEILVKLTHKLDNIHSKNAKASIIWLLGEFAINYDDTTNESLVILHEILPDIARKLTIEFREGNYHVRLETLIFISKLLISKVMKEKDEYKLQKNNLFKIFNYVLLLCKNDIELDIRDMSRLIGSVLPNVIYVCNSKKFNERYSIDEILENDFAVYSHCVEKCHNIDIAVLIFQLDKPRNVVASASACDGEIMSCVARFFDTIENSPSEGYEDYYSELRTGLEVKQYKKQGQMWSLSSSHTKNPIGAFTSQAAGNRWASREGDAEREFASMKNNNNSNTTGGKGEIARGGNSHGVHLQSLDEFLGS